MVQLLLSIRMGRWFCISSDDWAQSNFKIESSGAKMPDMQKTNARQNRPNCPEIR